MPNKYGIPEEDEKEIRARDKTCVYCHKKMQKPQKGVSRCDWATIEHLNFDGPFYRKDGLQKKDLAICCFSCNASRGKKKLEDWFKAPYCLGKDKKIDETTVTKPVKEYFRRINK